MTGDDLLAGVASLVLGAHPDHARLQRTESVSQFLARPGSAQLDAAGFITDAVGEQLGACAGQPLLERGQRFGGADDLIAGEVIALLTQDGNALLFEEPVICCRLGQTCGQQMFPRCRAQQAKAAQVGALVADGHFVHEKYLTLQALPQGTCLSFRRQ